MRFSTRSLTLAFGLCGSTAVQAFTPAPWTRADTLGELAYIVVVAADCGQSEQITNTGHFERNPFLPKHPSRATVRFICLGSIVGHAAISYCLPIKYRRDWQVVTCFLEVAAVTDNYFRAGLQVRF